MATPEEIIEKVNSVSFHGRYWQTFVDYLRLHSLEFRCTVEFAGNYVRLTQPENN